MRKSLKSVVAITLLATVGCGDETCRERYEHWSVVDVNELEPSLEEDLRADLTSFEAKNPGADANAKLEFLFFGSRAVWRRYHINADIKKLIDEAALEGGLSVNACDGLCSTDTNEVLECDASVPEWSPGALRCRAAFYSHCGNIF